jgi:hypothetical protein
MFLKNWIREYDNVLPLTTVSKLLKVLNKNYNDYQDAAVVGNKPDGEVNKKIRDVKKIPFNGDPYNSLTLTHWNNLLKFIIENCAKDYIRNFPFIAKEIQVSQLEALKYEKNGHYVLHADSGDRSTNYRVLSCSFLLNNDYEGGELVFDLKEKELFKVKTAPAKIIMWPSNFMFPHTVMPVTKGVRHSIVSWLW